MPSHGTLKDPIRSLHQSVIAWGTHIHVFFSMNNVVAYLTDASLEELYYISYWLLFCRLPHHCLIKNSWRFTYQRVSLYRTS
jgi:hypothetical protein